MADKQVTSGKGSKGLTPRQGKALAALLQGKSHEEAAHAGNVTTRQLYRWRQDPTFAAELTRQRDAAFSEALARLRTHSGTAVEVTAALLGHSGALVRLAAARVLLSLVIKAQDQIEFDARLSRLEGKE